MLVPPVGLASAKAPTMPDPQQDFPSKAVDNDKKKSWRRNHDGIGAKIPDIMDEDQSDDEKPCLVVSLEKLSVAYVNSMASDILGFPAEMLLGRRFLDFVYPKDQFIFTAELTSLMRSMGEGKSVTGGSSFYCRLREYKDLLKYGYDIKAKRTVYKPFQVSAELKVQDANIIIGQPTPPPRIFCMVCLHPIESAYKVPDETPSMLSFGTRHTSNCYFSHMDPSAIPYLGYLPQDLVGNSIFEYYHPDDLSTMKKDFENLLLHDRVPCPGHMSRVRAQNGCYVKMSTDWSCFINPWTCRLEFVIGQHKSCTHGGVEKVGPRRMDMVHRVEQLLSQAGDVPFSSPRRPCSSKEGSVMMGQISPCREVEAEDKSGSSSSTLPSYNQLNYNDNIIRFFKSQQHRSSSDDSSVNLVPFQSPILSTDDDVMASGSGKRGQKSISSGNNSNGNSSLGKKSNGNMSSNNNSRTGSSNNCSNGERSHQDTDLGSSVSKILCPPVGVVHPRGHAHPSNLTKEMLSKHNQTEEKMLVKQHKEDRQKGIESLVERFAVTDVEVNVLEILRNVAGRSGKQRFRGLEASGNIPTWLITIAITSTLDIDLVVQLVLRPLKPVHISAFGGTVVSGGFCPNHGTCPSETVSAPLIGQSPHMSMPTLVITNPTGTGQRTMMMLPNVSLLIPSESLGAVSDSDLPLQYPPCPPAPGYREDQDHPAMHVSQVLSHGHCLPSCTCSPSGKQVGSRATSVKVEPGSGKESIGGSPAFKKETDEEADMDTTGSFPFRSFRGSSSKPEHCSLEAGVGYSSNTESSPLDSIDSFLKTDLQGSPINFSSAWESSNDTGTVSPKKINLPDRPHLPQPFWLRNVDLTSDLVFRYQMDTQNLDQILLCDQAKIDAMTQPLMVNKQLGVLYGELEEIEQSAQLALEEGSLSGSSDLDAGQSNSKHNIAEEYPASADSGRNPSTLLRDFLEPMKKPLGAWLGIHHLDASKFQDGGLHDRKENRDAPHFRSMPLGSSNVDEIRIGKVRGYEQQWRSEQLMYVIHHMLHKCLRFGEMLAQMLELGPRLQEGRNLLLGMLGVLPVPPASCLLLVAMVLEQQWRSEQLMYVIHHMLHKCLRFGEMLAQMLELGPRLQEGRNLLLGMLGVQKSGIFAWIVEL
ncbi:unnamed protein product [Darwinula stevensoni]|uniref:Period circadian protein n=1 Tax=Darwinula stevensoni TaxID=69355 RepID=A0A7R8XCL4_9CRUS|nr:unnamed protein product [Darwinula stevensoni]CAG0892670.1 unnamed protein product [Darwinula stevensoni]